MIHQSTLCAVCLSIAVEEMNADGLLLRCDNVPSKLLHAQSEFTNGSNRVRGWEQLTRSLEFVRAADVASGEPPFQRSFVSLSGHPCGLYAVTTINGTNVCQNHVGLLLGRLLTELKY